MTNIPQKLFDKAVTCGLVCYSSEQGEHRIQPEDGNARWCLTYAKGRWVLISNGIPQMHFQYEEVMKFLDRFSQQTVVKA